MTKEKIQDAVYTHRFVYNFHYHLILVTKYRHQTFAIKKLADEMKETYCEWSQKITIL